MSAEYPKPEITWDGLAAILSAMSDLPTSTQQEALKTALAAILARLSGTLTTDAGLEASTLANTAFCCSTNDLTSGTGEVARLLISNPAGSGKRMKIYQLSFGTNVSTNNNIFRLYHNPTVSANGAALNPVSLHAQSAMPASAMQLFSVPTVSANGTLMANFVAGPTSTHVWTPSNKLILEPGQRLLVTVRPNTSAVTYSINVFWIEEP